jgi:outer membrane protein assembly factor BamB
MTGRILRIELRRSAAWISGAVVLLLGAAALYVIVLTDGGALWDQQWTMLAVFQRQLLVVLWPLALGAGAWQARRDRRSRMGELLSTTARPLWQRAIPTSAAMAIGLAAGYVAMLLTGAVRVAAMTGLGEHRYSRWR